MARRAIDQLTGDLFSQAQQASKDVPLAVTRIRQYANNEGADRLGWWIHGDRQKLRDIPVWNVVFRHLRAALRKQAMALPARSGSEDSQRHRAGGAPLGMYGENAVTFEQKGDK
jgi:hypothetical protein